MSHIFILSPSEKRRFDLPPTFTKDERNLYFSLTPELKRTIFRFKTDDTRAGFMLQLAYFRANARFFPMESLTKRDVEYVRSILKCSNIDLSSYSSTILARHRQKILTTLNWQDYDKTANNLLISYATRQTLEFDRSSSSKSILVAIDYFKASDSKIGGGAPRDFLTKTKRLWSFAKKI